MIEIEITCPKLSLVSFVVCPIVIFENKNQIEKCAKKFCCPRKGLFLQASFQKSAKIYAMTKKRIVAFLLAWLGCLPSDNAAIYSARGKI